MPSLLTYYDSPITSAINQPLKELSWVDTTGTTIDCSTGNAFKLRVNGTSGTISLNGFPPVGIRYALELHLDWASGSITWPIEWNKGDALPTATGGYVITAVTLDGGNSFKIAVQSGTDEIIQDGLVLHLDAGNYASYPGTGTTWTDLAGSNNGTLTNGPTYSSANGGSIVFDGSNDYVATPSNAVSTAIDLNTDFTIELVFKVDNTNRTEIFLQQEDDVNGTGRTLLGRNLSGNTNVYSFLGGSYLYSTTSPTTAAICHFYLKYSSGDLSIGKNGAQEAISTRSLNGSTGGFRIGSGKATTTPMDGNVYICRMYNRALSATEITQNFNATRERFGV